MLGENTCTDRTRKADGSWNEFPARWNAVYFLNGHGIQERYWTPTELPDGTTRESRLTFYEISAEGFRWKSDCRRVRP